MADQEIMNKLRKALTEFSGLHVAARSIHPTALTRPVSLLGEAVAELELREAEAVVAAANSKARLAEHVDQTEKAEADARACAERLYEGWGLEELEQEWFYRQELGRGKLATHLDTMRLMVLHELIEKRNQGVAA